MKHDKSNPEFKGLGLAKELAEKVLPIQKYPLQNQAYVKGFEAALTVPGHLSKSEIEQFTDNIVERILENGDDPLEYLSQVKRINEATSQLLRNKELRGLALNELDKEFKGKLNKFGIKFESANSGDRLDYSLDPEWAELDQAKKKREADLKLAYKKLHAHAEELVIDGEVIPVVPIKTAGGEIIKMTF